MTQNYVPLTLRATCRLSGAMVGLIFAAKAFAEAPLPVESLGASAGIVAEIDEQLADINGHLASADSYRDNLEKLKQSASLVAVLAQALIEHPEESRLKASGASLRNASIVIARGKTYEEAHAALPKLNAAAKGEAAAGDVAEFDWAKLTKMHPIMEMVSGRGAKFRRVLRRPKDPETDSRHVMVMAAAAISSYADTHEVKDANDLPQWRSLATEMHEAMSQAAAAVRKKDMDKARDFFNKGMETCTKCHEKFMD